MQYRVYKKMIKKKKKQKKKKTNKQTMHGSMVKLAPKMGKTQAVNRL